MGVLTLKYRPQTFEEVVGQDMAVKLLKAVAKNPDASSRSIVISGPHGSGKTTQARILGRALACENFKKTGKICGTCKACKSFGKVQKYYYELDSSVSGNVETLREMQPLFDEVTPYKRVFVLDESHVISKKSQAALLKTVEEANSNTFFIFCTTDPQDLLNTIHSRSLQVEVSTVGRELMTQHLKRIATAESLKVSDTLLDKIVTKSGGHMRDAIMSLNEYLLTEDETIIRLPTDTMKQFLTCLSLRDFDGAIKKVDELMTYPLSEVNRALNHVIYTLIKTSLTGEDNGYKTLAESLKKVTMQLLKLISEPWAREALKDDYLAHSLFLTIIKMLKG